MKSRMKSEGILNLIKHNIKICEMLLKRYVDEIYSIKQQE